MIIYVDIDNTICKTNGTDYAGAKPIINYINYINTLYDLNYKIVYWTSRGVGSGIDQYEFTENQLKNWGCKYHELRCDKPVYDLFIDDKTIDSISDIYKFKNFYIKINREKINIPKLSLFKNKKICLLGSGASLEKYNIDYGSYDLIVGSNRIYKTKYFSFVNVLYYNLSKKDDWETMFQCISSSKNFKYLILCPWNSGPKRRKLLEYLINKYKINNHIHNKGIVRNLKQVNKRPLTGIASLNHMIMSGASAIDIYGFDFYENFYIENLPKFNHDIYHDLQSNKNFLLSLIEKYPNKIQWNQ